MTRPPRRRRPIETPATGSEISPWAERGALALVLAAAAWLHRGIFRFGFFADDFLFLDQVRQKSLLAALRSPDPLGNFLRPLSRQVHFWVVSRAGHESPAPFHFANLVFFLVALVLFERIARRIVGAGPAIFATAILALHHAADVPLLWASGSQDLMALALALAALLLQIEGRRWWAAAAYSLALLSKETVLLTPLIAWWLAAREPGSVGRGLKPVILGLKPVLPMVAAATLWGVLWMATGSLRPTAGSTLHADPMFVPAALLHLVQSVFGLEWGSVGITAGWRWPPLVALAAAAAGVWWVSSRGRRAPRNARESAARGGATAPRADSRMNGSGVGVGLLWAASGALPVAAVAPIWSSYYYLYAMCGAALAIAALGARLPRSAMIAMLAILATLSARAGAREEFATAPGAWTTQSHVTRFYIERAATIRGQMLDEMRRARPTLPHRSTLFFGSVPSNIGWQAGDGPLVRWAYRDSSLRSYFLNQFSYPRAKRGPICFFTMEGGHLKEIWKGDSSYTALAINMMIDDHPDCSRDAIQIAIENGTTNNFDSFMLVWLDIEAGRMDEARARLARLGLGIAEGQAPELLPAMKAIREGADTLRVMASVSQGLARHPFDAGSHGFLADLLLIRGGLTPSAEVEAFASRVLAPDAPWGWRRWAQIQVGTTRYRQAALSLDRYFALAGPGGDGDAEAKAMREELKRWLPGGELTQRALRESASATGAASPAGGP